MSNPFMMEDDDEAGDDSFADYVTTEEDLIELERRYQDVLKIHDPTERLVQAKVLVSQMRN